MCDETFAECDFRFSATHAVTRAPGQTTSFGRQNVRGRRAKFFLHSSLMLIFCITIIIFFTVNVRWLSLSVSRACLKEKMTDNGERKKKKNYLGFFRLRPSSRRVSIFHSVSTRQWRLPDFLYICKCHFFFLSVVRNSLRNVVGFSLKSIFFFLLMFTVRNNYFSIF